MNLNLLSWLVLTLVWYASVWCSQMTLTHMRA